MQDIQLLILVNVNGTKQKMTQTWVKIDLKKNKFLYLKVTFSL